MDFSARHPDPAILPARRLRARVGRVLASGSLMIFVVSTQVSVVAAQASGRTALPNLGPMRSTRAEDAPLVVAGQLGVGFFEARPGASSVVRLGGGLSLAYAPIGGLQLGLSFDGALDLREDARGRGVTGLGVPELEVRYVGGERVRYGAAVALAAPGADAPSLVGSALTPTFSGLFGVALGSVGHVDLELSVRLDRSGRTVDATYSTVDRTTMGVSDASSCSVRIGYGHRVASGVLYASFAPTFLLGDASPGFAQSPSKFGLGYRSVGRNAYELALELSTSATVDVQASADALPVAPRAFLWFGGRLARLGPEDDAPDPLDLVGDASTGGETTPTADAGDEVPVEGSTGSTGAGTSGTADASTAGTTAADGADAAAPERSLRVVDARGEPIVDARVTIDGEVRYTDGTGTVLVPDARTPRVVRIESTGFAPVTLTVAPGEVAEPVALVAVTPHGTVRGEVRDLDGNPIAARLRIVCGRRTEAVEATGDYAVDLVPGRCTVEASATGYATERRTVTLRDGEVAIVNFDLRRR